MSTEQRDLEENALATRLSRGWDKFRRGQLISYPLMAVILIAVTAIGLTWYILRERAATASKVWVELEGANTLNSLEEFAKTHQGQNPTAARVARLEAARVLLGPEGIEALTRPDPKAREAAVANVEKARGEFEALAGEFGNDQVLKAQCYLGCARAEQALIGVSVADKPQEFRGSVDRLIGWLDKLAEAAKDTDWGNDAKKFADALRTGDTRDLLTRVQVAAYSRPAAASPSFEGLGPLGPGGGLPSIPGFPGLGEPKAPSPPPGPAVTPAVTPSGPPNTGTAPISPSVAPVTPGKQSSDPIPPKK